MKDLTPMMPMMEVSVSALLIQELLAHMKYALQPDLEFD